MDRAAHYRELAEQLRIRSRLTDPETREQLRVAALDFERMAQEVEEKQLRQKAELFRRVARTPAGHDPLIDRELLRLADQFEQEADEREEYLKRQSERFSVNR